MAYAEYSDNNHILVNSLLEVFVNDNAVNSDKLRESMKELAEIMQYESKFCLEGTFRRIYENNKIPLALLQIINNTESPKSCILAIDLLEKLLLKRNGHLENCRIKLIKFLTHPNNYQKVFHTLHTLQRININSEECLKLLEILNVLATKRPRYQFSAVPEKDVKCISSLMFEYKDYKDHSEILVAIAKQICRTKKFCQYLGDRDFFDSLYSITISTLNYDNAIRILKAMSKSPEAVAEMRCSERTMTLILMLINSNLGTRTTKKQLIGLFYKVAKKVPHKLTEPPIWQNLLDLFKISEKFNEDRLHMSIIKIYTLLNLGSRREVMSSTCFEFDSTSKTHCEYSQNLEDSENDNDDSEEEEEEINDDKEDSDDSDDNLSVASCSSSDCEIMRRIPEIVTDYDVMEGYFKELLPESEWIEENCTLFEDIFDKEEPENDLRKIIEAQVKRVDFMKSHAYPDEIAAEADFDENPFLDPSAHRFDIPSLTRKLRIINGAEKDEYSHKIVYDLDCLVTNRNENGNYENQSTFECKKKLNNNRSDTDCEVHPTRKHVTQTANSLIFESRFESGNLRRAIQIGNYEYNLYLTPDTSTNRGRQWFYFRVSNTIADKTYTFNIVNFDKINSQFNYGMQPVMFSLTDHVLTGAGWKKVGKKIVYYGNHFTNEDYTKQYRSLTFSVKFKHNRDHCYLAYHYPYSYSRLMKLLLQFPTMDKSEIYSRIDNLCYTSNQNIVPMLTVTSSLNKKGSLSIPFENRPLVFLTARVHPGESNSSWIMDGMIKFLLSTDEKASAAREFFIFKIVPMLNLEGVIFGNTRSGLNGCDFNRCWKNPDKLQHPEVYHTKKLVEYAKNKLNHPIAAFIDIHGHSRKKNYFFYGCNPLLSWNKIDRLCGSYCNHQIIPEEMKFDEHMKASSCQYKIDKKKESTCRVAMWREFGIKGSLTLECSYCSGENKKVMTTQLLQNIGQNVIIAFSNIGTRIYSNAEKCSDFGLDFTYLKDSTITATSKDTNIDN